MDIEKTNPSLFFSHYGHHEAEPELFFAPGRVNLIGEHTDYNGGYVFPCALNFGTYLWIREIPEPVMRFASTNFDFKIQIPLQELAQKVNDEWINYPLGVIDQIIKRGSQPRGAELLYSGDIPNGAGLSSSASIELVTVQAIETLWNLKFSMMDKILISQTAENEFVGMNCGIMDQFAVANGQKDKALFLNCDTLDYELVPLELQDYRLIIANTKKRRGLTDSKYNERRSECNQAVQFIKKIKNINTLSGITLKEFLDLQDCISDPVIKRRAHHVISENHRVLEAIPALKAGHFKKFGKLMNESHDSLRRDYEVTGFELDTMVSEARTIDGVIGSRMTGAGFGGCTVSLVAQNQIEMFIDLVGDAYHKKTGLLPEFYLPEIGEGVRQISI